MARFPFTENAVEHSGRAKQIHMTAVQGSERSAADIRPLHENHR
jgi:hypothetical protein